MEENQKVRNEAEDTQGVQEREPIAENTRVQKAHTDRTKLFALAIILLGAGIAAWFIWQSKTTTGVDAVPAAVTDLVLPDVVAKIDGIPVSSAEYTKYYVQSESLAQQQGVSTADPAVADEIKKQALEIVVNTQLLYSAAQAAGKSAADADISAQMDEIKAQFPTSEAFETQLTAAGLTKESLRDDVAQRIIIDSYLKDQPEMQDLSVTAEEIEAAYQSIAAANTEIPALEDIRNEIEQQLLSQKQQAASSQIIQTLRDQAEIEILI